MVKVFKDYMKATENYMEASKRIFATCRLEEPSPTFKGRINVMVQAGSLESCQAIIQQVMNEAADASFTLPAKAADGQWLAIGHYTTPEEKLPEF